MLFHNVHSYHRLGVFPTIRISSSETMMEPRHILCRLRLETTATGINSITADTCNINAATNINAITTGNIVTGIVVTTQNVHCSNRLQCHSHL